MAEKGGTGTTTIITICIILITLSMSGCIEDSGEKTKSNNEYITNIKRNYNNSEELSIIMKTENINYSNIFNISRYFGNPILDKKEYVWANYIDLMLINFYETRMDYLKNNNIDVLAGFEYKANIYWDTIVNVVKSGKNFYIYNSANQTILHYETFLFDDIRIAINNKTYKNEIENLNIVFNNSYIIEMKLIYSEHYGSTSGFSTSIFQSIILDQENNIKLITILNGGYDIS